MDAQLWHVYCTSPVAAEPQPLTVRQWAALDDGDREVHLHNLAAWLASSFVRTESVDAVTSRVSKVLRHNAATPIGAKLLPAVTGENFVGKSTAMMRWARELHLEWTRGADLDDRARPVIHSPEGYEADLVPVLWVDLPADARIMDVDTTILRCLNLPTDGLRRDLTAAVVRAVRRHGVRLVVFDDVHLLRTELKTGRGVLDHVKHLNTEFGQVGASLVLVGADLEHGALVSDPQIASRCRLQRITALQVADLDDMRIWQRGVRQLEEQVLPHLPKGRPEMLFTRLAGELYERTQGYLGYLVELVGAAAVAAIEDGSFRITRKHLDGIELGQHVLMKREEAKMTRSGQKKRAS